MNLPQAGYPLAFLSSPVYFKRFSIFFLLMFACFPMLLLAQQQTVIVRNADQLIIENSPDGPIRYLVGNVILAQDTMTMYCDSAVLDPNRNFVEAHRKVRIVTSKQIRIFADRLEYNGQTKQARLFDHVRLEQDSVYLTTDRLLYDRNEKYGRYTEGGKLVDPKNVLTSRVGTYRTEIKIADFEQNVVLTNERYVLKTEKLRYRTDTKTAFFLAPTDINTNDGKQLYTDDGWFDTQNNRTLLYPRPWYRDSSYVLYADTIAYNDSTKLGRAHCNIRMHNADSSLWIYGDSGHFARANREVLITDHPYLIQHFDQDTLVLFADTLYAIDDSLQANRRLRAYRRVSVYMKNLKAKADSLEYDRIDSTLHLYGDPVLWSGLNQLSGDTLHIWIVNQTADSLVADGKAFVISRNDSLFDDQVKGKLLRAKFSKEQMVRLEVEGNSESIYLVKDEKKRIGLNQSVSASLRVELADNEPKIIVFKEEPEATFYPIHEVWRSENRLDGYRWRIKEQPPVYYNTKPVNEKVPAVENQERPE